MCAPSCSDGLELRGRSFDFQSPPGASALTLFFAAEAPNPLLGLAGVLIAGVLFGSFARRLGLPAVTGQVLIGVAMALYLGKDVAHAWAESLQPITHFALGLIAVTVGSHLDVRRLRNARKRLGLLVMAEVLVAPLIVFAALMALPDTTVTTSTLLAALAISTAPATVVSIVKELRAKGVFVKTLVASVALNNIACIFIFELARIVAVGALDPDKSHDLWTIVGAPLKQLFGAALIGIVAALAVGYATRRVVRLDRLATTTLIALLATSGFAEAVGLSSLLSCLFLGVALANLVPHKEEILESAFANLETAALAAFFTLAGLHLDFSYLLEAGLVAGVLVVARIVAKYVCAYGAMSLAGAPMTVRRYLGLALTPQAGIAIGLILVIQEDPVFGDLASFFLAVGLTSVTLNEIIGPVLTRFALSRSGDRDKHRPRLIDFLHEENIVTNFQADSMEDAIEKLTDVLIHSNHLKVSREKLLDIFLERERAASTCMGQGLAIPHGVEGTLPSIAGAMAISSDGLPFDTPDHERLHCIVLLLTPTAQRDRHLEVLASLARAISSDRGIRYELYHTQSAAHAYELLHTDEAEDFNYFLESDEDEFEDSLASSSGVK